MEKEFAPNIGHAEQAAQPAPSVGRVVHYRLSEADAKEINGRRDANTKPRNAPWPGGAQDHSGNRVSAGEVVPLVVTRVWPDEYATGARLSHHPEGTKYDSAFGVNGQALLDRNDSLWITSAPQADLPGCWFWPPRV